MNHWWFKVTFLWALLILLEYNRLCFSCLEEERVGLLKLKPSLRRPLQNDIHSKPDPLLTWADNGNSDCCGWKLVKCDNNTRRVIRLDLSFMYDNDHQAGLLDVSSFLPFQQLQYLDLSSNGFYDLQNEQDLERLKKLKVLILHSSSFSNNIFQSLSALTSLTVLDLSLNFITGSLSDNNHKGLCKLKKLQELDLSENMLSGSIPSCFKNLTSLKVLNLCENQLGGNLDPSLLSSLTSLEYIALENNLHFEGNLMFASLVGREFQFKYLGFSNCNLNISTTQLVKILGNQRNLMVLDLSNNNLHGEFPNSLVETNSKLKWLYLKNNSLTGHIHFLASPLDNLWWFDVSNNHIQGDLQPNIGEALTKLIYLNISNNDLGGEIPRSLGNMKDLEYLDLSSNNLSGKLPERLDLSCKYLVLIRLSDNRLEGQISQSLFNLTGLDVLDLSNNRFTGYVPNNNFQSFGLTKFDISQNHISGRIPHWFGNLSNLQTLALHDNSIEDYIPPQLCNLTSLQYVDLSQNQLSGLVPSCLITMPYLKYLHLHHNQLTGPLPKALLKTPDTLLTLDLNHNNLSGEIPNWFGFLLNLRVLLLKGNRFSGSIPLELCRLRMIGIMDLSHNNLSGSIPLCFTNITFGRIGVAELVEFRHPVYPSAMFFTVDNIFPDLITHPKELSYNGYEEAMDSEEVEFMMKSMSNSYKGDIINFMSGIDLSCNNLEGNIPLDIGALTEIRAVNLSHNQLTGLIPTSLSNMKQIESIDLSYNKLSGEIPSDLTRLSFLVVFSVAYNNLSGRVPEMVAQFSTFGEASYAGNPFLCAPKLLGKHCYLDTDPVTITDTLVGANDTFGIDPVSFLASFAATYVTCLLGFVIVLYINPYWRRRWFHFIDACLSFVFPFCSEAIYRREI